jgi:raffinose/stachyose/melibiose transport system permease protein
MLKPITATICITNVLWVWNDFLLPLISISDNRKYSLLLSTNTLFGQYSSDWSAILSALILSAVPVIIFYAIFQKQILKGITDGAIKG